MRIRWEAGATLEPRREAASTDAHGGSGAAGAAGGDDGLRHARPGRGDDDGASRGRTQGRPAATVRHAGEALPRAGEPVRGGLHRLARNEPAAELVVRATA